MIDTVSGEWWAGAGVDPPANLGRSIEEIVARVRSLGREVGRSGLGLPDRPRVVTIVGGRGTGKSTSLRFALRALSKESHCLVLPPIDPEAFASGDSLAGWVFAYLDSMLTESERAHVGADGTSLGVRLQELSKVQAVRANSFIGGLERRGLTWEDFARDAVKVPNRGVAMARHWADVVERLAAARNDNMLQLVFAVDDADLAPHWIASVVTDAQLLGASPRVALIFAADQPTLRQSLELAALRDFGRAVDTGLTHDIISPSDVADIVRRRIVKYFPRSLRVAIPPLSIEQRLAFRPLGEEASIEQLLARFPTRAFGCASVADYFTIRSTDEDLIAVSPSAHALSDNARDLRQLHEALAGVAEAEGDRGSTSALEIILRHGYESVETELPRDASPMYRLEHGSDPDAPIGVRYDYSPVRFGKTTAASLFVYVPREDDPEPEIWGPVMRVRRFVRHHTTLPGDGRDREPELSRQLTQLCFLAWELTTDAAGDAVRKRSDGAAFEARGTVRGLDTPGGLAWQDQITGGNDDSWAYWTVPDWQAFTDYAVFGHGWDVVHAAASTTHPHPGRFETVEAMLLYHLWLVLAVQASRRIPAEIISLDPESFNGMCTPDAWPQHRETLLERVATLLTEVWERPMGARDAEFRRWFFVLFPMHASRLFCSEGLSARLFGLWSSLVDDDQERARAAGILASIASEHIDRASADADIELVSRLDKTRGAALKGVREQLAQEREGQRAAWLSRLAAANIPSQQVSALQANGATRDTILGLYAAGVRPEDITQIAELFPPTATEQTATLRERDAE